MTYASKGVSGCGRERSFPDTGCEPGLNKFNTMAVACKMHAYIEFVSRGTDPIYRT
jgi:hypothetical protein